MFLPPIFPRYRDLFEFYEKISKTINCYFFSKWILYWDALVGFFSWRFFGQEKLFFQIIKKLSACIYIYLSFNFLLYDSRNNEDTSMTWRKIHIFYNINNFVQFIVAFWRKTCWAKKEIENPRSVIAKRLDYDHEVSRAIPFTFGLILLKKWWTLSSSRL